MTIERIISILTYVIQTDEQRKHYLLCTASLTEMYQTNIHMHPIFIPNIVDIPWIGNAKGIILKT